MPFAHGRTLALALALPLLGCSSSNGPDREAGDESARSSSEALTVKCGAPPGGPVQGRDVSFYQGAFDWPGAKASGVTFGYARISDGLTFIDATFATNWASMKSAGVMRGAYQFFEPGQDEVAQANLMVQKIGKLGDGDLPALVDVEATGGQAPATIAAKLRHWLQIVEAGTGKRPWIYTGAYFWQDHVGDTTFGQYPLWIAAYVPACPSIPDGWSDWTVWQYSDGGGSLDHDVFNGSLATLQGFARGDATDAFPPVVRRSAADVNGDGISDLCARASGGIVCELAAKNPSTVVGPAWSDTAWKDPGYASTVQFADVNGDGKADVCGRSAAGFVCQLSDGNGFPTAVTGPDWSDKEGWNEPQYYATIQLADVNGDGKADACARGYVGIMCWLSDGAGFPTKIMGPAWSDPSGWNAPTHYASIQYADLNGDGKDDICGRSIAGVECWLSDGKGFPTPFAAPAWSNANGWSAPATGSTLRLVDLDGDGKADLCGRAVDGIHCALSNGTGFGNDIVGPVWSDANGWARPEYYTTILFADVNGDGRSDICARAAAGVACHPFDGRGFGAAIGGPAWSDASGWNKPEYYRTFGAADVNGDGKDDLCARAAAGITCVVSNGSGFGAPVEGPRWSDATGWGAAPYYASLRYLGTPRRATNVEPIAPGEAGAPPHGGSRGGLDDASENASSDGCSMAHGQRSGESAIVLLAGVALVVRRRRRRLSRTRARRLDQSSDSAGAIQAWSTRS
jgi:GH25 family lysozyme M1 (1,4-beta-N-acetylmuramidase)